jgi:hydrogenase maturation protein HypF
LNTEAQRWRIGGRVQGVGYRPFIYRLAHSFKLTGWVRNDSGAVDIHAEGSADRLKAFGEALLGRPPPTARARLIDVRPAPLESGDTFLILSSTVGPEQHLTVPIDLFTCDECAAELRDPAARRYRYPFINCTQCGPRYTIIRQLPYDRCNTTLDGFTLCSACALEYSNPLDRRFHAEPLACAECGPALYWNERGKTLRQAAALPAAIRALQDGCIVALRGIGGYHLLCDAANERAVLRLRERKGRPAKPFAIMVPFAGAEGLIEARRLARISARQAAALRDPARPIVLVAVRRRAPLCASIAPGLREVGMMLPYSPLHHLLLEDFGAPLVATSGNLSGEPVLTSPEEAQRRLGHIADGFLHHDRPIARPADDAIVRVVAGVARPCRMGRGTAPVEMSLAVPSKVPVLAVGGHGKGTVALAWGSRAVVSPHIGDYSTPHGRAMLTQIAADLQALYGVRALRIVHDAHPSFPSTRWALESGLPATAVWHHHAHAAAVAGEYPGREPMLCFTWDGIGLGPQNGLWGGEALLGAPGAWRRVASFRPFRLPGGERAAREPWRSALALCWECGIPWPEGERRGGALLRHAFDSGLSSPATTAVGRLFDAAAALAGICLVSSYEGEAPMKLEARCAAAAAPVALPLTRDRSGVWRCDWAPLVPQMLDSSQPVALRAAGFHASLAHALCNQALAVRRDCGVTRVGLAGGVFQNRILTEQAQALLGAAGFEVLIPQRLPLNDAAISFGQIVEATALNRAPEQPPRRC